MNMIVQLVFCCVLGYIVGCVNPSFLLGKLKGFDIRMQGSGNAGASNAIITIGKGAGLFCALFDIFKAYVIVKISIHLFPLIKAAGLIAGVCCILGHIFPVTMHFHGGKGLASLGGVILAYNGRLFVSLLLIELILVLIFKYICIVPTSCSVIFALYMAITRGTIFGLVFIPAVITIFVKHVPNFKRIRYGIEARFSMLWNKEAEVARIQSNWDKLPMEDRELFDMGAFGEDLHSV